jgi:hypothetical protein
MDHSPKLQNKKRVKFLEDNIFKNLGDLGFGKEF